MVNPAPTTPGISPAPIATSSAAHTALGGPGAPGVAVIIVDHGSRRQESNQMLEDFVALFARLGHYAIVEAAHMEIAEPSIATAFARCVARGAKSVVVSPYFLLPGKHWYTDIPNLTRAAAREHPGISYLVAAPIGLHPLMVQVIQSRIDHCLAHAAGATPECDICNLCADSGRCALQEAPAVWGEEAASPEQNRAADGGAGDSQG